MSDDIYYCIGRGACGSIWALPIPSPTSDPLNFSDAPTLSRPQHLPLTDILQMPHVLKRADGDTGRSIANDKIMHRHFLTSTKTARLPFQIAHSYMIIDATDAHYPRNFPAGREPCETYIQERIPPLGLTIRQTLISLYCPERLRSSVTNSRNDEDCLVRLYCGKRRSQRDQSRQKLFFTLRNYGLCVDQMEFLHIDVNRAVEVLAQALANAYWVAHIDANDAEWVFGLPRAEATTRSTAAEKEQRPEEEGETVLNTQSTDAEVFHMDTLSGKKSEAMVVWMLDFDCVRLMSMDATGVQQAVDAFYRNDPYFPRPWANEYTTEDERLWGVFRQAFLHESDGILGTKPEVLAGRGVESEVEDLAWMWVQEVEREGRRRAAGMRGEDVENVKDVEGLEVQGLERTG
ncbi:hypothetical protein N0V86_002811 [Didymella sp. IMI 355093]|nr:hypothetical protein N0V86_002811 [Didymella sp. IMI 355093]